MLEFQNKEDAVIHALENNYKKPFKAKIEGEIIETNRADRAWAVRMCPILYYDLYDENPEIEECF